MAIVIHIFNKYVQTFRIFDDVVIFILYIGLSVIISFFSLTRKN